MVPLPNGMEQFMKWFVSQFALAAAIPLCITGQVVAQDEIAVEQPAAVEQAPMPEGAYIPDGGAGVIYDGGTVPAVPTSEVAPPMSVPACDPLAAPPFWGIHPQPLYYPPPIPRITPFCCPTTPLYPNTRPCFL